MTAFGTYITHEQFLDEIDGWVGDAKVQFVLTATNFYRREGGGWIKYPPYVAVSINHTEDP